MWALLIIVKLVVSNIFILIPLNIIQILTCASFFSHGNRKKNMKKTLFSQPEIQVYPFLGGGFKYCLFSSLPGEIQYFSNALKPPTSFFPGNQWFNHQPVLRPRPYLLTRSRPRPRARQR